jgi:hypothetical protein
MKNNSDQPHRGKSRHDEKLPHNTGANRKEDAIPRKPRFPRYPILGQKAEDYLREEANIEDLPDEKDQEDYDKTIAHEKKQDSKNKKPGT